MTAASTMEQQPESAAGGARSYRPALTLLASLFFMWGFITVINNTLLPHLRSVFALNYTQATLIESVWFVAYFVASIPSALLIERIGHKRAIVIGLLVMALAALMMIPAARIPSYWTLAALFVIASGMTLLRAKRRRAWRRSTFTGFDVSVFAATAGRERTTRQAQRDCACCNHRSSAGAD
jgi:FHS family L-fucose permease-like MFS transporter